MIQTLEAVRALEEGVLTDIREGDVGAILGWGFMPWSGGPFSWLDMLGAGRAVEICDGLAAAHGAALRARRRCCARWPRRARASTAASARPSRRPEPAPAGAVRRRTVDGRRGAMIAPEAMIIAMPRSPGASSASPQTTQAQKLAVIRNEYSKTVR